MIAQTIQIMGVSPETLYHACLSSRVHSAMTAGSLLYWEPMKRYFQKGDVS
jgi:hypothetical protein